ncbi:glycosyltransferase family 2 protein [Leptospira sp. 96542]|nr:glycosyltransferase family 2 protein [Leptospira sp. 96542]
MSLKTLVVIPAYNEAETIEEVIRGAIRYADVSVTDDASKDATPQILSNLKKEFGARLNVIRHDSNTHIPRGIQDGMKYGLEKGYDWVITMDAGLSHDAEYIEKFKNFEDCDLVIGSRTSTVNVPLYRKLISWLAAKVMNYCLSKGVFNIFGANLMDCTSGYRRYSRRMVGLIANYPLESVAFDFHMESLSIVSLNGGSIKELPINYIFSNSSFNRKVLKLAITFAKKLLLRKWKLIPKYP